MIKDKTGAFSLVELSVTLVIAGFLMAAISGGAHLVQAAKNNKVVSEISGYVTAVNNFKDKYRSWPGDMVNATSYWASASNGDGNEKIVGTGTEALYAWKQMSLSGLIAGSYSGTSSGNSLPLSYLSGANYYLYYFSAATTSYDVFSTSGNALQFGAANTSTNPWIAAITPADAYIIDTKIDDGFASTGSIYSIPSGLSAAAAASALCVDNNYASSSANYRLTDNTTSCRILYWLSKI